MRGGELGMSPDQLRELLDGLLVLASADVRITHVDLNLHIIGFLFQDFPKLSQTGIRFTGSHQHFAVVVTDRDILWIERQRLPIRVSRFLESPLPLVREAQGLPDGGVIRKLPGRLRQFRNRCRGMPHIRVSGTQTEAIVRVVGSENHRLLQRSERALFPFRKPERDPQMVPGLRHPGI